MPPWLHACSVASDSWDPMDCSPPGSSVHEISQARTLKQVATYSSRGSSWSRKWTCVSCVSCIGRRILYRWTTRKAPWERQGLTLKQYAAMLLQQTFTHKHRNTQTPRRGFLTRWVIDAFQSYQVLALHNTERNLRVLSVRMWFSVSHISCFLSVTAKLDSTGFFFFFSCLQK